ncbi:hypothetical protein V5799_010385 [Amblyomma americanum]|uniref:Serine protease n=1 Tax=Amblyomma americanum TaxID=6943 RepID=A0AAQ4EKB7_AMBAM
MAATPNFCYAYRCNNRRASGKGFLCHPARKKQRGSPKGVWLHSIGRANFDNGLDSRLCERVRLDFEAFDLETSSQCSTDIVLIRESGSTVRTMCSDVLPKPYLSVSREVTIVFLTDKMKSSRGFRLRFTATNDADLCSSTMQFQCGTAECIPRNQVCNGRFDCPDGSDEKFCSVDRWSQQLVKNATCGTPAVEPSVEMADRIVGGEEAVPHSWPWQVSIQKKNIHPAAHFCGGTLISNELVITAAHCFMHVQPSDVVVKLGSHNLVGNGTGVQIRTLSAYAQHSRFAIHDMTHDVAVLKLSFPVNFTEHVRPVCLPGLGESLPVNTTCYSTGWGATRGSGSAFLLKQARLKVRHFDDACSSIFQIQPRIGRDYLVCAVDESDSAGPCNGDSGGPLVCQLSQPAPSSNWTLVGMTSMGTEVTRSSTLCGMGSSTIWSGVIPNRRWIDRALRSL